MRVVVSNTSPLPIYEQIKEQVKAAILAGELTEGQALPSIRALARDLRVSVITTTRAYTDLAQEGFVANVQGKGSFVLPLDTAPIRAQLTREVETALATAVRTARTAGLARQDLTAMLARLYDSPEPQQETS